MFFKIRSIFGSPARAGLFALIPGLLALAACNRQPAAPPAAAEAGTIPIAAAAPAKGFELLSEDVMTTGTRMRLRWVGAAPRPNEDPDPIGLCLPGGQRISARWTSGTLNGKPLVIYKSLSVTSMSLASRLLQENAGLIDSIGVLRQWPIYSLKPGREIVDTLVRGAQQDGPPRLELTLDLHWPQPVRAAAAPLPELAKTAEGWRRVASALVLNPAALDRYRVAPPPGKKVSEAITDPRRLAPGNRPWARVEITTAGLTRLDPDDLLKAGFPASELKPENLRLFSHGKSVPVLLAPGPELAATVKPGLYFMAQAGEAPYSASRTYWVTAGANLPAQKIGQLPLPTTKTVHTVTKVLRTAVRNIDNVMQTRQSNFLAIEGLEWVEMKLEPDRAAGVTLELPHYLPGSGPLQAEMDFFINRDDGLTPFHIEATSDREVLANFTFFNFNDGKKKFNIPEHCVKQGRVTISLRLTTTNVTADGGDPDKGFWFDRLAITYPAAPRLLGGRMTVAADRRTTQPLGLTNSDMGAPTTASLLAMQIDAQGAVRGLAPKVRDGATSREYRFECKTAGERMEFVDAHSALDAPTPDMVHFDDLTAENQGADIVLITHHDFAATAEKLKKQRESEGWAVRMVDVQSIYDTFSNGELSPLAIKSFLSYTLRHWKRGAPGQVLIVGDCTSDYLNRIRNEVRNWVPTYTYDRGGESWAADYWFTTIAGEDDLGDMMLGRLSVADEKDAATVVQKAIDYGAAPKAGPWLARLTYVCDDGEFPEVVEDLRKGYTPPAYGVERIYLNELPLEDNWYLPHDYVELKHMKVSRTATERILESFRKGTTFMTYYGHGSPNIWTDERIWFGGNSPNSDNMHLAGTGYQTFVANMTCNSGAIDYPLTPWNICITEDMMRVENGGAIACFVPSGPGVTTVHREMSKALHYAMFDRGLRRFGELTTLAKAKYALTSGPDDLIYMYHLLGDPALGLQLAGQRGRFNLTPDAVTPGATAEWTLSRVEPAAGQWIGELVGGDGRTIWSSPAAPYQAGRIVLKVPIPAETKAESDAVLRIYAWDAQSGKDLAASGALTIQRPQMRIDRVQTSSTSLLHVEISNPGKVKAEGMFEVQRLDGASTQTLTTQSLTLAPSGHFIANCGLRIADWGKDNPSSALISSINNPQSAIQVRRPGGPSRPQSIHPQYPLVIQVSVGLPSPPDNPSLPRVMRQQLVAGLPAEWLGWVRPLCVAEERANGGAVLRVAVADTRKGDGEWAAVLRTADSPRVTSQPLTLNPAALNMQRASNPTTGVLEAAFLLDKAHYERVRKGGRITLEPMNRAPRPATPTPPPLEVAALERRHSLLRFAPGSIKCRPAKPTEGETVFVDALVENAGDMDSERAICDLLLHPASQGGEQASDQMQNGPREIPPLAPGRTVPVTLRWDPLHNAGHQTLWARLHPATGGDTSCDHLAPVTLDVRTKAKLSIGRREAAATPRDIEMHHLTLKAEIRNEGQTEAHNVMVTFYRSGLQAPENKLGEVEVKLVPGGGSQEATFVWDFDPRRDMVRGTTLPQPTVQIWLKGSSQRISSQEP